MSIRATVGETGGREWRQAGFTFKGMLQDLMLVYVSMTYLPPLPLIIVRVFSLTSAQRSLGWSSANFPAESQLGP